MLYWTAVILIIMLGAVLLVFGVLATVMAGVLKGLLAFFVTFFFIFLLEGTVERARNL